MQLPIPSPSHDIEACVTSDALSPFFRVGKSEDFFSVAVQFFSLRVNFSHCITEFGFYNEKRNRTYFAHTCIKKNSFS